MKRLSKRAVVYAGLTTLLLLSSSMTPVSVAHAARINWQPPNCDTGNCQEITEYAQSQFGYCDAEVLGKYWQMSTWNAKLFIGRKLMLRNEQVITQELRAAFGQAGCGMSFNFEDAPQVAELWTSDTVA